MRHILLIGTLLAAFMAAGCSDDAQRADEQLPDGYGRLAITISTPEAARTRAVSTTEPWLLGTDDERAIKSYHLLICQGNTIMQAVSGSTLALNAHEGEPKNYFPTADVTSDIMESGTYNFTFYCLANFTNAMVAEAGLTLSEGKITSTTLPANFETTVVRLPLAFNGTATLPSTGMPMTGKLTASNVVIGQGTTTIADPLILWRMMAKLEFRFKNESDTPVDIKGIEVEPINMASEGKGIYLISQDNLLSLNNLVPSFPNGTTKKGVSAIWPLNTTTLSTTANVTMGGAFTATALEVGSKLGNQGTLTTTDGVVMQKFSPTENLADRDNAAVITFTVTPATGMTFTPKNLSFKASREGTDGGNFDVEAGTATLATAERPARKNGLQGKGEPPFYSTYSYSIDGTASSSSFEVKIFVYGLNTGKAFAFSDVIISGDVTNNSGTALQEGVTLPYGALTDVGTVKYETNPVSSLLTIAAGEGSTTTSDKSLFFYVNESDATFTTTDNQYSVRFRIQRNGQDEEFRYGVTTAHDGTSGGFNVIRRNDWIHIPVVLTDWQLRIEPLAFVPIAGYPATTLGSDGLTATFSTGGMVALQPFVKKYSDATWRDFSDPEVTFVSVAWKNSEGDNVAGDDKIVKTAFAYDPVTHSIIGELNQAMVGHSYKTTFTVDVTLGTQPQQYGYSFTFNVVLE